MDNASKSGPPDARTMPDQIRARKLWREVLIAAIVYLGLLLACRPQGFHQLGDFARRPLLDPAGVLQVYPWLHFDAAEFGRGHFPLWNPYTALGQPHLANVQTGALFPAYWPFFAEGYGETAHGLFLMVRLWLAGMLWFIFVRRRLAGFRGALVAGAAYAFGGYGLWFMQLIDLNSQMLLPLLLLAMPGVVLHRRLPSFLAVAALVCLAILGGHPEAAFITVFTAVLYGAAAFLAERKPGAPLLPPLTLLAGAGALGVILSLAVTLPFLNYLPRCWSMHGPGFGLFHLDPRAFFNLLIPEAHRLFTTMPTEIPVSLISAGPLEMLRTPYHATAVPGNLPPAGLVIVGLALVSLVRLRKLPWPAAFFAGIMVFYLGLTLGLPGFRLMALVPPFSLNSNFKFFFSEIHAALAVLAGVGFEQAWKWSARGETKTRRGGRIAYFLVMGFALIVLYQWWKLRLLTPSFPDFIQQLLIALNDRLPSMELFPHLWVSLLFLAALFGWLAWVRWRSWFSTLAALAIIGLSLFIMSGLVRPFIHLGAISDLDLVRAVKSHLPAGEDRVAGIGGYWPANISLLHQIKDIRSSDALFYKPYVAAINRLNGFSAEEALGYFYPSYFMRLSPGALTPEAGQELAIALVLTDMAWLPQAISDRVKVRGSSVYKYAPPQSGEYPFRALRSISPGLMVHAPGRIDFRVPDIIPNRLPDSSGQFPPILAFGPRMDLHESSRWCDGAAFFALAGEGGPNRLAYARFSELQTDRGRRPPAPLVSVPIGWQDTVTLAALPGPRDNANSDYAVFAGLAILTDGQENEPPPPLDHKYKIYPLPHLPWAHGENSEGALPVNRAANDLFSIDLAKAGSAVIIHEAYYSGWRAWVDGVEKPIEAGEGLVSWRLPVPAGAREAVFKFEPVDFRVGLWCALTASIFSLIMLGRRRAIRGSAD